MPQINYLAVVVAAAVHMVLGMLWYSKSLFGKQWMKLVGKKEKDLKMDNMAGTMLLAIISALVIVHTLAYIYGGMATTTAVQGSIAGAFIWLGFIATTSINNVLWRGDKWQLWILNNGYYLVSLLINGAIIAAW